MFRHAIALAVGVIVAAPALAQDAEMAKCELDRPVVFADLNYGSAQFHTAVASRIIRDGFGCEVDSIPGDTIPLINGVARGDADIIMEIWTANPAQAWVDAEADGKTVALGTTFPDAIEGWFVPTSVVSGDGAKAPDLKSVADLANYTELFEDPEEPGKGRFYNCPAGWHCEVVNTKKLEAYGLADKYTNFRPGTGEALAAAAEQAALRDKPAVFYYWGPTWLLGKYDFTKLEEPAYDASVWKAMMDSDHPTEATASPITKVIIGGNTEFTKAAPKLAEFLKSYASTNAVTSTALAYMRDNDASPDEAAVNFLKTTEDWTRWLPASAVEGVKSNLGE
ncbi:MAG: ABC transporter substrate-binding protein [Bauldia sp.]|uniref:ABC transporter substrate-binding protein n=1 Tax=Bauldia sp. TaxID=2575872 RepID=UPI001D9EFE37|nr:ABC transporter substrate-binding protein [Bauldia sp.]MCB1494664.1 ABC transporter substrate-binding protein [Bauldia sp.]